MHNLKKGRSPYVEVARMCRDSRKVLLVHGTVSELDREGLRIKWLPAPTENPMSTTIPVIDIRGGIVKGVAL